MALAEMKIESIEAVSGIGKSYTQSQHYHATGCYEESSLLEERRVGQALHRLPAGLGSLFDAEVPSHMGARLTGRPGWDEGENPMRRSWTEASHCLLLTLPR